MAQFDPAFAYLMQNEDPKGTGELLDDPHTGEYSRYGITLATAVALKLCQPGDKRYIDGLSPERAKAFYRAFFWAPLHLENLCQPVATKLFDMAVNMGHSRGVTLAQQAARALGSDIAEDGVMGWKTLSALNTLSFDSQHTGQLLLELAACALEFYRGLVTADQKYERYWNAWHARAEKMPPE